MRYLINFYLIKSPVWPDQNLSSSQKAIDNLDPIVSTVKSFDKHPSKVKIKTKLPDSIFHFSKSNCNEVWKIIGNLNIKKPCQQEPLGSLNWIKSDC